LNNIAVIGGGPAGMIAAGIAGSKCKDVTLFEKNEKLGKKLFITGKGRCNITNSSPIEDFFDNIMTNKEFLYSALYSFTNDDIINLLNKYGLKTKVERGNRVFPITDKSSDVIKALNKFLIKNDVKIRLNKELKSIKHNGEVFELLFADGQVLYFDKVIIATGGRSYPVTGSTGDGYIFAKKFGHSIVDIKPALVPCEIKESWVKDLQGLTLKNVTVSAYIRNKKVFEEFGEMIFTHFGISGPVVLTMSNFINKYMKENIKIYIDLKPALTNEKLDARILRDFEKYQNKHIKNALNELLPNRMIPIALKISDINEEKTINQITKDERIRLVNTLKKLPLSFMRFRPVEEAIITSGGISTIEINPSTMESKKINGLYFAGEVIDVDALTGGYNLQIAYSTGFLAGMNC
jgi:hypothetical protein